MKRRILLTHYKPNKHTAIFCIDYNQCFSIVMEIFGLGKNSARRAFIRKKQRRCHDTCCVCSRRIEKTMKETVAMMLFLQHTHWSCMFSCKIIVVMCVSTDTFFCDDTYSGYWLHLLLLNTLLFMMTCFSIIHFMSCLEFFGVWWFLCRSILSSFTDNPVIGFLG